MQDLGISYDKALSLLDKYVKDNKTRLHLLESEIIMRAVSRKLGEDEEKWGIIGLLHDIDWDLTKNRPEEHCLKAEEILRKEGASDLLIETIQSHAWGKGGVPAFAERVRQTPLQHLLAASETLTGLIVACALVMPDKKLASVSLSSLEKKFRSPSFAKNCRREIIAECELAGIPLDEFLSLSLTAMKENAHKLGL